MLGRISGISLIVTFIYNFLKDLVLLIKPSFLDTRKKIEGQVAVVTGGGNGLGRQLSLGLANLGVTVVIWDVDKNGALVTQKMIREKGQRAYVYVCDVSDREEVYKVAEIMRRKVGKVDILVNNAGVINGKFFLELQDSDIEKTYGINTLSHYWTCKAFLPDMIKDNKGHVLAIASLAGVMGVPKFSVYSGTKHAILGFMESIQMEVFQQGAIGVKMTTACPSLIKTGMVSSVLLEQCPYLEAKDAARIILDGMLKDKEVVFLPTYASIVRLFKVLFLSVRTFADIYKVEEVSTILETIRGKGLSDGFDNKKEVGNQVA